jgi:DNA-binding XRE family transcriptional regulator
MTTKRKRQARSDRTAASKKNSAGTVNEIGPLVETFGRSEVESGIVSRQRGRALDRSGPTPDDIMGRLAEALVEASLARLLRTARDRAGLTLSELAERLGVSRGRVHQLERDGANLELGTVGRLAAALCYEARIAFLPREANVDPALIAPLPMLDEGR